MRSGVYTIVVAGIALVFAGFLIYLPFELGASLTIPPDSSEYAIGLTNLLQGRAFGFTLNGSWYPSRYAPWFSLSCLAPAYYLFGGNSLCYHWMIALFSLGTLALVSRLGRMFGMKGWMAALPAVSLMFLPDFVFYSRVVMTEIPYVCLFAASAVLFCRLIRSHARMSAFQCLAAGLLVAWCGAVRSTGLSLLIPFAVLVFRSHRSLLKKCLGTLVLSFPSLCLCACNLAYNRSVFGSPLRNGYHFWLPVPCDCPELLFSLGNVAEALRSLSAEPVVWITLISLGIAAAYACSVLRGAFGGLRENGCFVSFLAYVGFHGLVLVALYLGYYWVDTRFYLALTVCLVPLAFAVVDRLLRMWCTTRLHLLLMLLFLGLAIVCFLHAPTRYGGMTAGRPMWLEEGRMTALALEKGSVVIQDGDPNVMDHFGFAAKGITLLPYGRRFDYVTNMVAPTSARDAVPRPTSWRQKTIPEWISHGICRCPFPVTLLERPETVAELLRQGRRVFFHEGCSTSGEQKAELADILRKHGLTMRFFQVWKSPAIEANPVRHLFDKILFPEFMMDSRPEVTTVLYEIIEDIRCRPGL